MWLHQALLTTLATARDYIILTSPVLLVVYSLFLPKSKIEERLPRLVSNIRLTEVSDSSQELEERKKERSSCQFLQWRLAHGLSSCII